MLSVWKGLLLIGSLCAITHLSTGAYLIEEQKKELRENAREVAASPGKGILVLDDNAGTFGKRLATINLENTEENRRKFRQLLFATDKTFANGVSSVVMDPEGFYQKNDAGVRFVDMIKGLGIVPGVRVDQGFKVLLGTNEEITTQGLTGLFERLEQYYENGGRFAKWRAVFKVGRGRPSELAIMENVKTMARFASICQMRSVVPFLAIEITTSHSDDLEKVMHVTEKVLVNLYKALFDYNVYLEGVVLQPTFVQPGYSSIKKYTNEQVAEATITVLQRTVPPAVSGIAFTDAGVGGDSTATAYLNAISKAQFTKPWRLTFSFDHTLRAAVMKLWGGKPEMVKVAQDKFELKVLTNSLASVGKLDEVEKHKPPTKDLHVSSYNY